MVLLVGPRAIGKTTTALRHAATVVRLDRPAEAAAFKADADAALRGLAEPVLLDEWQAVPGVLGALKRAVDVDPRPGRYLLTGSIRAELSSTVRSSPHPSAPSGLTARARATLARAEQDHLPVGRQAPFGELLKGRG